MTEGRRGTGPAVAALAVLVTAVQTRTTLTPVGLWYFLPQVF